MEKYLTPSMQGIRAMDADTNPSVLLRNTHKAIVFPATMKKQKQKQNKNVCFHLDHVCR